MRKLDEFKFDLHHRAARRLSANLFQVPAILHTEQIDRLKRAGYEVEVGDDIDVLGNERLKQVSPINRFAEAQDKLDLKLIDGYLTNDEIENWMQYLSNNPALRDFVQVFPLPNTTWEGRTCHAVLIRVGQSTNRPAVLFTGGVHAREWGGSDICCQFLYRLIVAHLAGDTGIVIQGKNFNSDWVKAILEGLDIIVFPNVNPDGKAYTQSGAVSPLSWRKNRNPNVGAGQVGVDINRNYDFLWSSGIGSSSDPSLNTYKGPSAFSEPETRNVKYLLDAFSNISYFMDIHSYSGSILCTWGDDNDQNSDPEMNFRNPQYDGQRGNPNDSYGEYIDASDETFIQTLGGRMNTALNMVRSTNYKVAQSFNGIYPTTATSDDYAYSRHLVDPSQQKVFAYTVEFGQEFIPPHDEMLNIIDDVNAAMLEMCCGIVSAPRQSALATVSIGEQRNG